ncbi:GNAT family N-acetyltransferase [Vibrio sp. 10N.261.55.A7]|uniref:GNAT family N-acetyltransferase n=1 Tax=Vibrio sp. 10N.261.55.A7 TaxID=1880851 RepID=UPI000C81D9D9|nr:GNAT family N-acetyltransferase [Vibrio sp. 10N.261.55.A7]PMK01197.1 tRNA cytosine(34) acetyltransferase TmcA [Vibrio sp. 10N.261.55.A7]
MSATVSFLKRVSTTATTHNIRYGVVLRGDKQWQMEVVNSLNADNEPGKTFQLGGLAINGAHYLPFKQGKRFLGQECQRLICDLDDGFDANSFSASIGTLIGGGILLILKSDSDTPATENEFGAQWLELGLTQLINIHKNEELPSLPSGIEGVSQPSYLEQSLAIEKIIHVVEGHRKRPLVLTADRGRGKTSALGLASGYLAKSRSINIIVTAPTFSMVSPLFQHAAQALSIPYDNEKTLRADFGNHVSSIRYIAPDELVRNQIECDFLIVDEAAAIPTPMLKSMVHRYHRLVFSSTVHGYEGSGRGFSLKFIPWLKSEREKSTSIHLTQPIRWSEHDPLERWHNKAFLLDAELPSGEEVEASQYKQVEPQTGTLVKLEKAALIRSPHQFQNCFALLVNAHYQTSPNDLFHLLNDDRTQIYAYQWKGVCIGCLMTVEEGGLDDELIELIQQGKRRPSGQLVSVTIANQLGISEAAKTRSLRVMRIAVHPDLQRLDIGSTMLSLLEEQHPEHFLSTSFGATSELIHFWSKNGFVPLKVGSQRDKSSGCHSVIMVKDKLGVWQKKAQRHYSDSLDYRVSDGSLMVEVDVLRALFRHSIIQRSPLCEEEKRLLTNYIAGGASLDSVSFIICRVLLTALVTKDRLVSDLLMFKILQQKSWEECTSVVNKTGRKQTEILLKNDLEILVSDLQCKTNTSG